MPLAFPRQGPALTEHCQCAANVWPVQPTGAAVPKHQHCGLCQSSARLTGAGAPDSVLAAGLDRCKSAGPEEDSALNVTELERLISDVPLSELAAIIG